eukprot:TRINITY_DN8953_c0_g2_i1.p1 TRINITY_DN8953_c0_g2~~TRINITY_DN8953_c0_g2_i1.p1  ORF type:complete len:512 (-),score=76.73 TRINITY_DN8953_c0_g2_i1:99-1448(-)
MNLNYSDVDLSLAVAGGRALAQKALRKVQFLRKTEACKQKLSVLYPTFIKEEILDNRTYPQVLNWDFSFFMDSPKLFCEKLEKELRHPDLVEDLKKYKKQGNFLGICSLLIQKPSVILIDKYDYPIRGEFNSQKHKMSAEKFLTDIYALITKNEKNVVFSLVTGSLRVDKTGVFNKDNPYVDQSMHEAAATVCGYTQKEVDECLHKLGIDEKRDQVKTAYYGYSFSANTENRVYNSYSLNSFFQYKIISDYWSDSGMATDLYYGSTEEQRRILSVLLLDSLSTIVVPRNSLLTPIDYKYRHRTPKLYLLQYGIFTLDRVEKTYAELQFPNALIRESAREEIKDKLNSHLREEAERAGVEKSLHPFNVVTFLKSFNKMFLRTLDYANIVQETDETAVEEHLLYKYIETVREVLHIPKGIFWSSIRTIVGCLLYTSPSPRDLSTSRMPSSA